MSTVVVGLDVEHVDERRADHDLLGLVRALPAGAVRTAATHWATEGERPHVALSVGVVVGLPGPLVVRLLAERLQSLAPRWALEADGTAHGDPVLHGAARAARQADVGRRSGLVVHFPGLEALVGTVTVGELLERSAVERVRVLAAGDADPAAPVVTRGHVRPSLGRRRARAADPAGGRRDARAVRVAQPDRLLRRPLTAPRAPGSRPSRWNSGFGPQRHECAMPVGQREEAGDRADVPDRPRRRSRRCAASSRSSADEPPARSTAAPRSRASPAARAGSRRPVVGRDEVGDRGSRARIRRIAPCATTQ